MRATLSRRRPSRRSATASSRGVAAGAIGGLALRFAAHHRLIEPGWTVAFLGWFGPRGLASIVFGVILLDEAELPHMQTLLLAITVTIAISVYAHGLTAGPLTDRYVRWWASRPRDAAPAMEKVPAGHHRLRRPTSPPQPTTKGQGNDEHAFRRARPG